MPPDVQAVAQGNPQDSWWGRTSNQAVMRTSNQAVMGISRDFAERLANGRFVAIHRRLILVKFPTAFLLNREANGTKQG
jgi:hypothetical protein